MSGQPAATPQLDALSFGALVLLAVLWGSSFVLVEVLLTALPVVTLVAARVGLAALCLWAVVLLTGGAPPWTVRVWLAFAVLGLLNNALPFGLIVYGQTHITAGLASILNATTPLFTVLLAAAVLPDERLQVHRVAGIVLGVFGVAVMLAPMAFGERTSIVGELAVLGAALAYASAAVFARKVKLTGLQPVAIAAGQTTMSSAILIPLAFIVDAPLSLPAPSGWIWVAIVLNGTLITAFAYILYFTIMRRAGATNAALVTVLVPVVAVITGVLTLGEQLSVWQGGGMVLIAAGFIVLDGRWRRFAGK